MSKFYTLNQNNSGGYFKKDENVDEYVIIEASNIRQFRALASDILDDYRSYCSCCGQRWSDDWVDEKDGTDEPTIYNEALEKAHCFDDGGCAIIYYLDGRKERFPLTTRW